MALVRKIIFWTHLLVALVAGLVILIMAITGVLLTYERQIIAWAEKRASQGSPAPAGAASLPVEMLLTKFQKTKADLIPATFSKRSDSNAPAVIGLTNRESILVNPYTGEVLEKGAKRVRDFFHIVTDWHRWLGAHGESRATARAITGLSNLGFFFLLISGFYLWWPRKWTWQHAREIMWFKRGLSGKAHKYSWHNVIGLWCLIPLFIIVLSGVVISYKWADDLIYRMVGESPPVSRGNRGLPPVGAASPHGERVGRMSENLNFAQKEYLPLNGLDRLWTIAEHQVPGYQNLSMRLPKSVNAPVIFIVDLGDGGQPQKRSILTLERKTGEIIGREEFSSYTMGRQIRLLLRFAHTGEVAGIVGQTIAGIVSAGAAVLVWTGIAIAWRRFRAKEGG